MTRTALLCDRPALQRCWYAVARSPDLARDVLGVRLLGRDYVVWDKMGTVKYLKPGHGTLTAEFIVTQAMVDEAIAKTAEGAKFEPTYAVELKDHEGAVVATVEKTLYIRKKK